MQGLGNIIEASQKITIVVHTHPDGDALGSGLAMLHYLRENKHKEASLIIPDAAPVSLQFLMEGETVCDATASPREAMRLLDGSDLIFVQDLNDFRRTESLSARLAESKAAKVLIDHHLDPDLTPFTMAISRPEASSTCEILYFLLKDLEGGNTDSIPPRSLYALMTGLTTDTNNFANSVGPGTIQMAGELLSAGVDREDILLHLYQEDRLERLKAGADLMANHLVILPCGISYVIMTSEMQNAYGLREGESEGFVNMPLNVAKIKMSIFLREEGGYFRVSIRSKRGWSAVKVATECFGGGGHELAAGGKLRWPDDIASRDDAASYIEEIAARFVPNEQKSK